MRRRDQKLVFWSGIVAAVTLTAAAWTFLREAGGPAGLQPVPEDALLSRGFDRLRDNPQGYPEYRHQSTGIVMVRLPGGTVPIGVNPEYRRQFIEEYGRYQRMLMARKQGAVVFPDDEKELNPEERQKREARRELARGWLSGHPRHKVTLTSFLIAKYEVTQEQWKSAMGSNPSKFKINGAQNPAERVSWHDCRQFCDQVGLALPSEAQWEYACRAGSEETFAGTGRIDDMAWYQQNSGERTHPVGQKAPNDFGLYDMHGNVAEWCADAMDWNFYEKPQSRGVNPVCPSESGYRVFRGGAFADGAFHSRASVRAQSDPAGGRSVAGGSIGFRPVLILQEQPGL